MSDSATDARSGRTAATPFRAIAPAGTIQTAVGLAQAVAEEGRLHLDPDGLRLRAMDPATVAAVDVTLDPDAFEAYEADGGLVGADLSRLADIAGMADRDQAIRFSLDPETRRLDLRVGGLEYTLALLDPETVRTPPDRSSLDLAVDGTVVAGSDDVSRAVRAAGMVSDHVALGIDERAGTFYAEAEGDTDDVILELPADDLAGFDPGDARSLFSIDYLSAIDRALPSGLDLELQLGTEEPVGIAATFADGGGAVDYMVSPRIAAN